MRSWRRVPASRALGLDLGTRRPGRLGGLLLAARTEATDCTLIFSERHPGPGGCTWKPHGSCGSAHGVRKDRKCSFRYGVYQIAAARRGQPQQKEQASKCLESL